MYRMHPSEVVERFPDGVVCADQSGTITYLNAAAERMLGWTRAEAVGKPLTVLMPARMTAAHERGFQRYNSTRRPHILGKPVRVPAVHRDGHEVDIELTLTCVPDQRGDVFVAAMRDLRNRVDLEEQIKATDRASAHYAVMHALLDASSIVDAAQPVLRIICTALQWDVGLLWLKSPDDASLSPAATWSCDAAYEPFLGSSRAQAVRQGEGLPGDVWRSGQPVWVRDFRNEPAFFRRQAAAQVGLISAFAFPVQAGGQFHGVAEFFSRAPRDPDDALLHEAAAVGSAIAQFIDRARIAGRLRESEDQFRALAENLPALCWTALPDGRIDYYNRRWFEYTGTTFEEMHGWGWTKVHDPQVLPKVVEAWKHSLATGEPFELEFPLRAADGTFRWFLTRVSPLRGSDGRIIRWFGLNTNVDAQRQHARELLEAVATRDTFLSIAGHELKTPITALSLRLDSLRNQAQATAPADGDKLRKLAEAARSDVGKLLRLVNGLLDASRIAENRLQLELEETDVVALVHEIVASLQPRAQRAGCEIQVTAPASLTLRTSRLGLSQVLTNLVDNAIKYGPGQPISIAVRAEAERLLLAVRDRGIGVPGSEQKRIFERFARAVPEKHYGGLGLGLYISRSIVELLGGALRVESAPGQGATFTVELALSVDGRPRRAS